MPNSIKSAFVVQKILDKRYVRGKPQYLVKWLGLHPNAATWEPLGSIPNQEIIREYDRRGRSRRRAEAASAAAAARAGRRGAMAIRSGPVASTYRQEPVRTVSRSPSPVASSSRQELARTVSRSPSRAVAPPRRGWPDKEVLFVYFLRIFLLWIFIYVELKSPSYPSSC